MPGPLFLPGPDPGDIPHWTAESAQALSGRIRVEVTVLVNGEPSHCVGVADRGFQYGDGVFTTIPVRHGVPLFLERHFERLERDSRKLLLPFPDRAVLLCDVRQLCRNSVDGVLKIQITRGAGGRGYRVPEPVIPTRVLSLHAPPEYPPELAEQGIEIRICNTRLGINPNLAGIKHMNRLEQILARAEWDDARIREGLMLDGDGHVVEGTMTNLFIVEGGGLLTPRLDFCGVAGVMRGLVFEGAAELRRPVLETRLDPDRVLAADEMFLTNSVIGLWPVARCEGRIYPVGPITRELQRWLTSKADSAASFTG